MAAKTVAGRTAVSDRERQAQRARSRSLPTKSWAGSTRETNLRIDLKSSRMGEPCTVIKLNRPISHRDSSGAVSDT